MSRDEAAKKVTDLLQEIEKLKQSDSTTSLNKLVLESEIAKARVEGLSLIS